MVTSCFETGSGDLRTLTTDAIHHQSQSCRDHEPGQERSRSRRGSIVNLTRGPTRSKISAATPPITVGSRTRPPFTALVTDPLISVPHQRRSSPPSAQRSELLTPRRPGSQADPRPYEAHRDRKRPGDKGCL